MSHAPKVTVLFTLPAHPSFGLQLSFAGTLREFTITCAEPNPHYGARRAGNERKMATRLALHLNNLFFCCPHTGRSQTPSREMAKRLFGPISCVFLINRHKPWTRLAPNEASRWKTLGRFPRLVDFAAFYKNTEKHFFTTPSIAMCWKRRVYVNKCFCSALYLTTHACISYFLANLSFGWRCECFTFHITNNVYNR